MIKKLLVSALFAASYSSVALADNAGAAFKTFPLGKLEVTALHDKDNYLTNDAKVLGIKGLLTAKLCWQNWPPIVS